MLLEAAGVEFLLPEGVIAGPPWGVAGMRSPTLAMPNARLAGKDAMLLAPLLDALPAGDVQGMASRLRNYRNDWRISSAAHAIPKHANYHACWG